LARGLKIRVESESTKPLDQGLLLIIIPFDAFVKRVTTAIAAIRNQIMIEIADEVEVVVGYANLGGQLDQLLANYPH
jgi:hypothetical protein